jgi:hypothetical protein
LGCWHGRISDRGAASDLSSLRSGCGCAICRIDIDSVVALLFGVECSTDESETSGSGRGTAGAWRLPPLRQSTDSPSAAAVFCRCVTVCGDH